MLIIDGTEYIREVRKKPKILSSITCIIKIHSQNTILESRPSNGITAISSKKKKKNCKEITDINNNKNGNNKK